MRAPANRGVPIDDARIAAWAARFRFYRFSPDGEAIRSWLDYFKGGAVDVAARILDCVEVVREADILAGYRTSLNRIPGWSRNKRDRDGNWYFVGYGYAGESGQAMVRTFREANRLAEEKYDYLFCTVADLPSKRLTSADHVIFIDDFIGTGRQVCARWRTIELLIGSDAECHLIVTASTDDAKSRIHQDTPIKVEAHISIHPNENFFSPICRRFTQEERNLILPYCRVADAQHPKGFGDAGLLYVLNHKTPNNSLPILHANHPRWRGLFPRYLLNP